MKPVPPSQYILAKQAGYDRQKPHLQYDLPDPNIHRFVLRVLLVKAEREMTYSEKRCFRVFLKYMVCIPFGLSEELITECEEVGIEYGNKEMILMLIMIEMRYVIYRRIFSLFIITAKLIQSWNALK